MSFSEWRYLFPPRPESAVTCDLIRMYQRRGWVGQFKKNGTCAVIGIGPEQTFQWFNRHQDTLKWEPPPETVQLLWEMFGSKAWTVLIGELIHSKVKDIRNRLYLFDYVVLEGHYALGSTFTERQSVLYERVEPFIAAEARSHYLASRNVWLARTIKKELTSVFHAITSPEDEGLVLKDPWGKLRDCERENTNGHWQVKVRHPRTNFAF